MYDIAIFGGDTRQIYMAQYFKNHSYSVITYGLSHPMIQNICSQGTSLAEVITKSNVLIGSIPLSKDLEHIPSLTTSSDLRLDVLMNYIRPNQVLFAGMIPEKVTAFCKKEKITFYDFMKEDSLAISNGIATAEGAIMEAIAKSSQNLHKANVLVLGFGRCAKVLAHKLKGLDANVTICARKAADLSYADAYGYESISFSYLEAEIGRFEYIFNSIPCMVLPKQLLCRVMPETVIIDIASDPGGLDYEAAKELSLNASLVLGIPGKVAPFASAKILANYVIQKHFVERRFYHESKR